METNEEIKQQETAQEVQQTALPDPPEESVGDIMTKASGEGWKWLVVVASAFVYLAGIVYAEVHGLTMLQMHSPVKSHTESGPCRTVRGGKSAVVGIVP